MELQGMNFTMIPTEDLALLKANQHAILQQLTELSSKGPGGLPIQHITAKKFMEAASIGRTKFDQLLNSNKIKVIKKRQKIYLSVDEIDRFFKCPRVR